MPHEQLDGLVGGEAARHDSGRGDSFEIGESLSSGSGSLSSNLQQLRVDGSLENDVFPGRCMDYPLFEFNPLHCVIEFCDFVCATLFWLNILRLNGPVTLKLDSGLGVGQYMTILIFNSRVKG